MSKSFIVSVGDDNYSLDAADALAVDLHPNDPENFHLIYKGRSHTVVLEQVELGSKSVLLRVDGKRYLAKIEDDRDQLIRAMGLNRSNAAPVNDVVAPMPGLVLDVLVRPTQEVTEGDGLLILEAMKMENMLRAPATGAINSIRVQVGDAVEKGQVLIEMA